MIKIFEYYLVRDPAMATIAIIGVVAPLIFSAFLYFILKRDKYGTGPSELKAVTFIKDIRRRHAAEEIARRI